MDNLQDIIDIKGHPIDKLNEYALRCRSDLQENAILILNKFLTKEALLALQQEAKTLQNKLKPMQLLPRKIAPTKAFEYKSFQFLILFLG